MILTRRPLLTPVQQSAYDEMIPHLRALEREFTLQTPCTPKDATTAYSALHYDHFEMFWLGRSSKATQTVSSTGVRTTLSLDSGVPERFIERYQIVIAKEIKRFLDALPSGASTYDKVVRAYEFVIENTEYDLDSPNSQNALGVFLDRKSVCAGYSEAFCLILEAMGIPSACVTGTARGGAHEWAIACIDGAYAFFDPTWGDPTYVEAGNEALRSTISHAYCCVTSDELKRTHTIEAGQLLPECTSSALDWYANKGLLVDKPSAERLDALLNTALKGKQRTLELKFSSAKAFESALSLVKSSKVFQGSFGQSLAKSSGSNGRISVGVATNDKMRTLIFNW